MPEVLAARFRYTPSGPMTVCHALLAWLSREAARVTGGTFIIRCESLKCTLGSERSVAYKLWWRRNFDELCAFGLTPTAPEILNATEGLDAGMGFMVADDHGLQQYYWRELGLEKMYGVWPPPYENEETVRWAHNSKAFMLGNYAEEQVHPYLILSQAVTELATRRNCLIRGKDHENEANQFNAMAQLVARKMFNLPGWDHESQYTPRQWFIPKFKRSGTRLPKELQKPGGVVLSSSLPAVTSGFYLKDVLEAKVPPYRVLRFLAKVLFGSDEAADAAWTLWGMPYSVPDTEGLPIPLPGHQGGVQAIFAKMVPNPVIDDYEWEDLMRAKEWKS